ncbi:MAG: DNA replication/repair protein RecF [Oscillospiraceae bacterium]|nr:DNA replication/repair protein RecF [Oscillospiraceae bacterium]
MRIDTLRLQDFRNYTEQSVAFAPDVNVVVGGNAQGKTNLLEAIVYLSRGKSVRARADRELIRFGAAEARLSGALFSRGRDFTVEARIIAGRRRVLTVNQVGVKRAAELADVLGTVFFCPEDLFLIRDGAAARRRFMDQSLSQLRPRYAAALAEYNRLYEHKTRILRDSEEHPSLLDTLPEFNTRMALAGAVLIHYRARYCARLEYYAAAAHRECSGGREALSLRYETVKTVLDPFAGQNVLFEQLMAHQQAHAAAELASRLCLSGPHKDDILVEIGGENARQFSSQGQTRTAALAFKLAERDIYQEITGRSPVLLLDDVLSELDPRRQEFVLNRITGGQVFITCCEEDRLGSLLAGKVLHVEQGQVS